MDDASAPRPAGATTTSPVDGFAFTVEATIGRARTGRFDTPHGPIHTPQFMPVGTLGTIKALTTREVKAQGAEMILANAYHLYLRPGDTMVRDLGGLHAFMRWDGPILTDSGGFQVFSLEGLRTVKEEGVHFRSHLDGSKHFLRPEDVIGIERNLGADVIMQFDHVVPGQAAHALAKEAMERSLRWLDRCRTAYDATEPPHGRPQALFPIVQGGIHADLRRASCEGIVARGPWAGIAVGGLSVGEAKPDMHAMLETCDDALPRDVPRYLMGVGFPEDLLEGVARGVDLFDCVAPTRMGRNGTVFTPDGKVHVKRGDFRLDRRPLVEGCGCPACTDYDRAYLRHLHVSEELLGLRLLSLHNVSFLLDLMRDARAALRDGSFDAWRHDWLARYHSKANRG
jgi:queuine tRNA-ribosyltransferase